MAICGTNAEVIAALERYRGMDATFDQGLDDDTICFAVLQAYNSAKESYICVPETKEHAI